MTAGTPEAAWDDWLRSPAIRPWPTEPAARVVAVAAHPDDETLGVGGLLRHLHETGAAVELVVATDGEAAFPEWGEDERADLARRRRAELRDALREQGLGDTPVHWLGLPDSGLDARRAELRDRLAPLLAGADVCLAPWPGDPHPDHRAVGEEALAAAPLTAHRWSYPIWAWHWLRPEDDPLPRDRAFAYRLDADQRRGKAAALAAFASQLKPGPCGEEPILSAEMLEHFGRDVEIVFRQPPERTAPAGRFAQLYAGAADPWDATGRWYERRKRALALASLPDERYGTAVEPACGVGVFTRDLADRCDRVLAFDPVPDAVGRAAALLADRPHVAVARGTLPGDLPAGPVDLLVFGEILYYLGDADLAATVDGAVAALRPGGHLLAVHWRPWAAEAPRDGAAAHRVLLDHPGLEPLVEHVDEAFLLHVLRRR